MKRLGHFLSGLALMGTAGLLVGCGSGNEAPTPPGARTFEVTLTDITSTVDNSGQSFSPPVFVTHDDSVKLWENNQAASLGVQNIAETGNQTEQVNTLRPLVGSSVLSLETPLSSPLRQGKSVTVRVTVDAAHPYLSHLWMLDRTNDGFGGQNAVNIFRQEGTKVYELLALDAGTEVNNEKRGFLGAIGGGNTRAPESGVIRLHEGITGTADAPLSWNWNKGTTPANQTPVARVTITPAATS